MGSAGDVGLFTSLALDLEMRPHITYYDRDRGDLKYARWDGQKWEIQAVETAGDVGQYTSLALDGQGRPHVSYYDAGLGDLKYAYWDGKSWVILAVDSPGNVGKFTSLALDPAGPASATTMRPAAISNMPRGFRAGAPVSSAPCRTRQSMRIRSECVRIVSPTM